MIPRRLPFARRCRASARVSTPAIAGDPIRAQERGELPGVVEDGGRRVRDDEAAEPWSDRLVVVDEPAVVADQRIRHDHDLAGVRGVGADLLVARLARVHDEVAAGRRGRTECDAGKDGAVLEGEEGGAEIADSGVHHGARSRGGWCDHAGTATLAIDSPSRPHGTG